VSGTTRVNWCQKGKTRKVKPIWIYCSNRQWAVVASAGPYANLHLANELQNNMIYCHVQQPANEQIWCTAHSSQCQYMISCLSFRHVSKGAFTSLLISSHVIYLNWTRHSAYIHCIWFWTVQFSLVQFSLCLLLQCFDVCRWLGSRKGIWPVKKLSGGMLAWLSGMRCRLAYSPADATATHSLLLQ